MEPPVKSQIALFAGFSGVVLLLFGASSSPPLRGQDAAGEPVAEIPSRFFQTQDVNGYFWQIAGNGAITSGDTQYLQSGLNWIIDGAAFAPTSATVRSPEEFRDDAGVSLREERGTLTLSRELWMDRTRGGVRTLDTLRNAGSSAVSLDVVLRTTYPFAWQSLHGVDGELLSKDPVLALDERDFGFVVHFSAAEGRHDTFLVVGGGEAALQPKLTASNNRRELTLAYRLAIPAGGSQTLLHWVSQRALPEISLAAEVFGEWYARNELVNPAVSAAARAGIANFPAAAFPGEAVTPGGLRSLLALNGILDALGIVRRGEDMHWISSANRVTGTITEAAPLKLVAKHLGEITLPLAEVAAIRGGGGVGRKPVFFLRNGEVRVGEVADGLLTMLASGGSEAQPLDLSAVHLLLMRTGAGDGAVAKETGFFVQLMDQSVFAIRAEEALKIPLVTPRGPFQPPITDLEEAAHVSNPFPGHRFLTTGGSYFSGFLAEGTLLLPLAVAGEVELANHLVDRIWRAGASGFRGAASGDEWLSIEDVPGRENGGFLFPGNVFLQGELAEATLRLVDAGTEIPLEAGSIQSIKRDPGESPAERDGGFHITMKSGEVLRGRLVDPFLSFLWGGTALKAPVESLLAFEALVR